MFLFFEISFFNASPLSLPSAKPFYLLFYLNLQKRILMETILLRGDSKANSKLLLELAKKLNFSAKKLSAAEVEEFGIGLSIDEGLKSGLLTENEKQDFMKFLKQV